MKPPPDHQERDTNRRVRVGSHEDCRREEKRREQKDADGEKEEGPPAMDPLIVCSEFQQPRLSQIVPARERTAGLPSLVNMLVDTSGVTADR
jgi:hypothetical protein